MSVAEPQLAPRSRAWHGTGRWAARLAAHAKRRSILQPVTPVHLAVGFAFLFAYVALDWLSFVQPFQSFGITPWNPSNGVSIALLVRLGMGYLPVVFAGPLLADAIVRWLPAGVPLHLLISAVVGGGYALASWCLMRPALAFDYSLRHMRDVLLLIGAAVITGAVVGLLYVFILAAAGFIAWQDFATAFVRYWIGDLIGTVVLTPLLLIFARRHGRLKVDVETLLQVAAIFVALWAIFGLNVALELHVFYVLFLPVVWVALRHGFDGACLALLATQIGLMLTTQLLVDVDVTVYQAKMLVLAITGLAVGMTVTERRQMEAQLRLQQEAQARLRRIDSVGELAATLAHEINQPLAAANTYARIAHEALEDGGTLDAARQAIVRVNTQIERAADVVRRLRDFIQKGRVELAPVAVAAMVRDSVDIVQPQIGASEITLVVDVPPLLPAVMADRLQIGQALVNILQNAIEAIRGNARGERRIEVTARSAGGGVVEIEVHDSGPGFTYDELNGSFEPFATTKPDGLGIGLSITRSIMEAHGGALEVDNGLDGAIVRIRLPQTGATE